MIHGSSVLNVPGLLRMIELGRFELVNEMLCPGEWPAIRAIANFRQRNPPDTQMQEPLMQVIDGWGKYYRAQYDAAVGTFYSALEAPDAWTRAWAAIGVAKVATDTGYLGQAADWCVLASALARHFEIPEHHAASKGALGEVLLRGGQPGDALVAFDMDYALLDPGVVLRGRILCYRAHAYSRLGVECAGAAELAYRLAMHTPGEPTNLYALAGLCLLAAEHHRISLLEEAAGRLEKLPADHLSPAHAWALISRIRMACEQDQDLDALPCQFQRAYNAFPEEYHYERQWVKACAQVFDIELIEDNLQDDTSSLRFNPRIPLARAMPDWRLVTAFDRVDKEEELPDAGFANTPWCHDLDGLWRQRKHFMP